MTLSRKALAFFALLFVVLAAAVVAVQARWIDRIVIDKVSERMATHIRGGWRVLASRRESLELAASYVARAMESRDASAIPAQLATERARLELDILAIVDASGSITGLEEGLKIAGALPLAHLDVMAPRSGFSSLPSAVARELGVAPQRLCTPGPDDRALVLFASHPIPGSDPKQTLVAANVLDCADSLVDAIARDLFDDEIYEGRRVGTVTIFHGTRRIATTVLDEKGQRAIGTEVSAEVADKTLRDGEPWTGRAWVVNDWYLARYEPIRDPADAIIGMLYIGELERLHLDERRDALIGLTLVVLGVVAFGFAASLIASRPAIQQIATLEQATRRFAQGDFAVRASVHARDEIGSLAHSFNAMAEEIERDRTRILEQKSEIEATNRNYLDMLGFVTHEFRGTLGAALFNVQLLEDAEPDELTEDSRELARLVGDALRSLDEITREYLELARIESGALVVNRKEVALVTDVIEPVMRDLQAQIRSRRMTVAINVPAALTVPADPTLLRVIYHNVVGNAVKYGAEGGRITLDHASETDRAVLSVWNEGRAIPADALPTLFRKFSRHDVDEATGRSGSGLGLFIVKQIVLGHGGEVWVESEEGRGTRLSFSIRTG